MWSLPLEKLSNAVEINYPATLTRQDVSISQKVYFDLIYCQRTRDFDFLSSFKNNCRTFPKTSNNRNQKRNKLWERQRKRLRGENQ